jgi:DNA oxidative demethylase
MLFDPPAQPLQTPALLAPDFWLLRGFATPELLMPHIETVAAQSPFRHMTVPGGRQMSVAITNCGAVGWTANERGYQYTACDPESGGGASDLQRPWPVMPPQLQALAIDAAAAAGWPSFAPDACLINRYEAGASMGLHQDRDERDLTQPIVSMSLGASCRFLIGGFKRTDATTSVALHSGDVLVWGGASRLVFHGVRPVSKAAGTLRYNLTFRKAQ